jgi:hypothetical protein
MRGPLLYVACSAARECAERMRRGCGARGPISEKKLTLPKLNRDPLKFGHLLDRVPAALAPDTAVLDAAERNMALSEYLRACALDATTLTAVSAIFVSSDFSSPRP